MGKEDSVSRESLLGALADGLGILGFLLVLRNQVTEAIDALEMPSDLNFYFLFFWAFVAALLGGLAWNMIVRVSRRRGASRLSQDYLADPRGFGIVGWSLSTMIPVVLLLITLNLRYRFSDLTVQVLTNAIFLVGWLLGGFAFYERAESDRKSVRSRLNGKFKSRRIAEFWFAVIWVLCLCIPSFSLFSAAKTMLLPAEVTVGGFLWAVAQPTIIALGLTVLAVTFFLLVVGTEDDSEQARGIVAGLALRVGVFFGLFLASA